MPRSFRFLITFLVGSACGFAADGLSLSQPRCEYRTDPLGIHAAQPRLSWLTTSPRRGAQQTAYEILVASSPDLLAQDRADLWASGKVHSQENAQISYAGSPLGSRQTCYWKVRVWDGDDQPSSWSPVAHWEMGLLQPADWSAKWIEAQLPLPSNATLAGAQWVWDASGSPGNERFFRHRVTVPTGNGALSATLRLTADNAFTLFVDGAQVAAVPAKGKESWKKVQIYDLGAQLTPGDHVLAIAVSRSPAHGGLVAKLVLSRPGQPDQELVTSRAWKVSASAAPAWTTLAYDDSAWPAASEIAAVGAGPWGRFERLELAPVPLLGTSLVLADKPIVKARVYATALGLYDLQLNGQKVGDHALAPEWTDYSKRVRYQVFDITRQLHAGANALTARLANGWYAGRIGNGHFQHWGTVPALLAQVEVTYADGSTARLVSDATWKFVPSAITSTDFMLGESYDARLAQADPLTGSAVSERVEKPILLDPQVVEPVRAVATHAAQRVSEPQPGRYVFDLGQNLVGVARITVNAAAGTVITIRHAEMLNPDGSLYVTNLRGAPSIDTYTCRGGGSETWQPTFTFHGFRYVELSGLTTKPDVSAVQAVVLGSDLTRTGEFTCSDPRLNQLQSNIWWGQRGNYLSVPTDCPQRDERMGWMGDAQVFVRTATGNAEVAAFFSKWLVDVDDAQTPDGAFTDVSPRAGSSAGTPAWADAGVICPWTIYRAYGDERLLATHYPAMVAWIEWCRTNSVGLLRSKGRGGDYGDWLAIGANTPKEVIGTAYFAYSTKLVAQAAAVLGKTADAQRYQDLAAQITAAFNQAYVKPDGRISGDTQCVYLMALKFDLLSPELREKAADHLVADITAKGDHLSTGFVGVSYLLPVLSAVGHDDVAFKLLLQDTFPSWLFSVKHGATTIWERWDGWTPDKGFQNPGMNSFNHYSLGSCGEWLYENLAGVAMAPGTAAYRELDLHPRIGGGLTQASYRLQTLRGPVASAWQRTDTELSYQCSVPVGSVATLTLPAGTLSEGGTPVAQATGVTVLPATAEANRVRLVAGDYHFSVAR
jgi:alpha-L-rhamnosidase